MKRVLIGMVVTIFGILLVTPAMATEAQGPSKSCMMGMSQMGMYMMCPCHSMTKEAGDGAEVQRDATAMR